MGSRPVITSKLLIVASLAIGACAAGCAGPHMMATTTDATPAPAAEAMAQRPAPARSASDDEGSVRSQERLNRNKKLAEAWNTCKFQFAEDLAGRTSRASEGIVELTFAACSREEDALKASFADGRMRPEAVKDTIARMRQTSQDQLLVRILAIRGERQTGNLANAKRD